MRLALRARFSIYISVTLINYMIKILIIKNGNWNFDFQYLKLKHEIYILSIIFFYYYNLSQLKLIISPFQGKIKIYLLSLEVLCCYE